MILGNSLAVQTLGLRNFTAEGPDLIPGQETRIPQVAQCEAKEGKEGRKKASKKASYVL